MKKFITVLICIIIVLSPIKIVKSAEVVTLTNESLQLLTDGIDLLSYSGSIPYGFLPFVFSSEKDFQSVYEDMFSKQDVFTINGQPNIRPLSSDEYSLLENATIYDDEGNIVTLQELYFGEIDNGYFTEKFYCKNDGTIVYQDSSKDNPYIDVKFGGSELSYVDWQNMYSDLADSLNDNSYHYNLNGNSVSSVSYYLAVGLSSGGSPSFAASVFIANQYQPGIIVPASTGNIASWYTNNPALLQYTELYGTVPSSYGLSVSHGNYTYNGNNYNYYCTFWGNNTSLTWAPNNTLENWIQGINPAKGLFAKIGYSYDSSLMNEDTISFKQVSTNADTIDLSDSYSLPTLKQYYDDVSRTKAYPNGNYISTDPISSINYPTSIVIEDDITEVVIPFPDDTEAEEEDPVIDYPIDDVIDPSLITDQIPILSGLQNKFPFSIPWDIAKLLKGLEAQRTTPYIDTAVTIPGVNYTWHIEYDLSDFDSLAELFRTLFLIAFIIGLAYFSYDHFFGS